MFHRPSGSVQCSVSKNAVSQARFRIGARESARASEDAGLAVLGPKAISVILASADIVNDGIHPSEFVHLRSNGSHFGERRHVADNNGLAFWKGSARSIGA